MFLPELQGCCGLLLCLVCVLVATCTIMRTWCQLQAGLHDLPELIQLVGMCVSRPSAGWCVSVPDQCKACCCKGHFSRVMIVPHLAIWLLVRCLVICLSSCLIPCPLFRRVIDELFEKSRHACAHVRLYTYLYSAGVSSVSSASELGCNLVYGLA